MCHRQERTVRLGRVAIRSQACDGCERLSLFLSVFAEQRQLLRDVEEVERMIL